MSSLRRPGIGRRTVRVAQQSIWLLLGVLLVSRIANAHSRYWIVFRDKGIRSRDFVPGNPVFEAARKSLSEACLERRSAALRKPPLETISLADAPLCKRYLDSLQTSGVAPVVEYKWGNAVSAELSQAQLSRIRAWSFVRYIALVGHASILSTEPVYRSSHAQPVILQSVPMPTAVQDSGCGYDPVIYTYGGSQSQLDRINVWPLHAMGFDASGIRLGFLDVGFNWRGVSSLDSSNVLFEYDYVFHDSSTANPQDEHGTATLSTAMGYLPDSLMGPAYKCSVMLAHTEDTRSERNIEEDNYANALEDFEARGVQITSSSLGYFTFDSGQHSYTYADMNGHTAICTQAVERAVKLGVLVVTAMGNAGGDSTYDHLDAPADADSILAVGALDVNDSLAGFSSRGPTFDGRIKPDICAPGVNVFAQNADGTFTSAAGGTSFATPLVSGACCLIQQAHPEATAQQIRHAVMMTGAKASHPDTDYGWGEINAYAAALELGNIMHLLHATVDTAIHVCVGAASKYGIRSVMLDYFGDSDINPHSVTLSLAADSLIYSATIPFSPGSSHLYYRMMAVDGSGATTSLPSAGWNLLDLPQSLVSGPSSEKVSFTAFPNPCSTEFRFQVNSPGRWHLLDMVGKEVRSGRAEPGIPEQIGTAHLANGAYEIEFISSSGSTQTALVIVAH